MPGGGLVSPSLFGLALTASRAWTLEAQNMRYQPSCQKNLQEFVSCPRGANPTFRVRRFFFFFLNFSVALREQRTEGIPRWCATRETGGLPRVTSSRVDARSARVWMTISRYPLARLPSSLSGGGIAVQGLALCHVLRLCSFTVNLMHPLSTRWKRASFEYQGVREFTRWDDDSHSSLISQLHS